MTNALKEGCLHVVEDLQAIASTPGEATNAQTYRVPKIMYLKVDASIDVDLTMSPDDAGPTTLPAFVDQSQFRTIFLRLCQMSQSQIKVKKNI